MAEDLDAELEDYWKGSVGQSAPAAAAVAAPKKKSLSLTGKKRAAPQKTILTTPHKGPSKVISLKSNNKHLSGAIDKPLSSGGGGGNNNARKPQTGGRPQQRKRQRGGGGGGGGNYRGRGGNYGGSAASRSGNPFHPQALARLEPRPNAETVTYPGKTKLFIGGLPEDYTENQLQGLLEPFGDLQECYLPQGKSFAIVTFTSRESAFKAQTALSCKTLEGGRTLRVRPSPDAAVWIGDLPNIATNELLRQSFSRFGPINRAIVCCDTRGRSLGHGIVEFSYKGSATNCIEVCTTQPFLLSRSPQPVRVEPFRYKEEDVGLPAKEVLLDRFYWQMIQSECNGPGPRMSDASEPIAMEWLNLYQQQKIAKQALKEKFLEERKELIEKQMAWFEEEEVERQRASEEVRTQRMEIMRREEQLRSNQAQLDHASAQVGFGAW